MRNINEKLKQTVLNTKMKFGGNQLQKLEGKERQQLRRKKKEFG